MQSVPNDSADKTKDASRHRGDNVRESHTMLGKLATYLRSVRFHRRVTQHLPNSEISDDFLPSFTGTSLSVEPKGHVTE